MFPCQDPTYRARYRQRRRRVTRIHIGPWEVQYDAREMRILFEGREVGVRAFRAEVEIPVGGAGKTAKYLIGLCAKRVLVRCADLHDQTPFDPAKFRSVFEWGNSQGKEICGSPQLKGGLPLYSSREYK
jgi:hypothetical protein